MFNKSDLITDGLPTLTDDFFLELKQSFLNRSDLMQLSYKDARERFLNQAKTYFAGSKLNKLTGLEAFDHTHVTMGCNHFIDNVLLTYGMHNVQVLEHDYYYYQRLIKDFVYTAPAQLESEKPLLMALPFPGHLDKHRELDQILDDCMQKNIPVFVDGSWMTSAKNIQFHFDHPAIQGVAMSLSKGMNLGWNRVGLRWSRNSLYDNIAIFNEFNMLPLITMLVGIHYLDHVPVDYLWNTYGNKYNKICQHLRLRPSNIVHAAFSIDRSKLYGLKTLIEN
jgi:hypothetical protein